MVKVNFQELQERRTDWSRVTMPKDAQERVLIALHNEAAKSPVKRRGPIVRPTRALSAGIVVAASIAVIAAFVQLLHVRTLQPGTVGLPATKIHYPAFHAPLKMVRAYEVPANDSLVMKGFNPPNDPQSPPSAVALYIVAKNSTGKFVVLKHMETVHNYDRIPKPMWFSAGGTWYAVIDSESLKQQIIVLRIKQDQQRNWVVRQIFSYSDLFSFPYKVGQNLLIRDWNLGMSKMSMYSFSKTGITAHPVTQPWPKDGSIQNSETYTIYASTKRVNGVAKTTISGSTKPIHMKLGQTLVVKLKGQVSSSLDILLYPDHGDPGDGSLATRIASPFTNAVLYRMDNTATHGAMIVLQQADPKQQTADLVLKVPVIVTR